MKKIIVTLIVSLFATVAFAQDPAPAPAPAPAASAADLFAQILSAINMN